MLQLVRGLLSRFSRLRHRQDRLHRELTIQPVDCRLVGTPPRPHNLPRTFLRRHRAWFSIIMRRDDAKPTGTVYKGKERTFLEKLELRRYQYTVVTGTGALLLEPVLPAAELRPREERVLHDSLVTITRTVLTRLLSCVARSNAGLAGDRRAAHGHGGGVLSDLLRHEPYLGDRAWAGAGRADHTRAAAGLIASRRGGAGLGLTAGQRLSLLQTATPSAGNFLCGRVVWLVKLEVGVCVGWVGARSFRRGSGWTGRSRGAAAGLGSAEQRPGLLLLLKGGGWGIS